MGTAWQTTGMDGDVLLMILQQLTIPKVPTCPIVNKLASDPHVFPWAHEINTVDDKTTFLARLEAIEVVDTMSPSLQKLISRAAYLFEAMNADL